MGGNTNDVIDFKFMELGDTTSGCTKMGDEFNPLASSYETSPWGNPIVDADTQGAQMDSVTVTNIMTDFEQDSLLQNLSGEDSLIGRGLQILRDGTLLGCCSIGRDIYRTPEEL